VGPALLAVAGRGVAHVPAPGPVVGRLALGAGRLRVAVLAVAGVDLGVGGVSRLGGVGVGGLGGGPVGEVGGLVGLGGVGGGGVGHVGAHRSNSLRMRSPKP